MESKNRILNKLNEYCRTTSLFSNGMQMSYGAVEFSFLAGLISQQEAAKLFRRHELVSPVALEVWEGKYDPENSCIKTVKRPPAWQS